MAAFGKQNLFKPNTTAGPLQKLAVNWLDGCWLGCDVSQYSETKQGRARELGCCRNPWRLHDGRVEVNPNHAALSDNIPMVNPEVENTHCNVPNKDIKS